MVQPGLDPYCDAYLYGVIVEGGTQPLLQYYFPATGSGSVPGLPYYCYETPGTPSDPNWSYYSGFFYGSC